MNFLSQITGVPVGGPATNLLFERANLVKTTNKPKVVSLKINFSMPFFKFIIL